MWSPFNFNMLGRWVLFPWTPNHHHPWSGHVRAAVLFSRYFWVSHGQKRINDYYRLLYGVIITNIIINHHLSVSTNISTNSLVGGFNLPLWKMMEFVNGKDDIPYIHILWKIKFMFETTNNIHPSDWLKSLWMWRLLVICEKILAFDSWITHDSCSSWQCQGAKWRDAIQTARWSWSPHEGVQQMLGESDPKSWWWSWYSLLSRDSGTIQRYSRYHNQHQVPSGKLT